MSLWAMAGDMIGRGFSQGFSEGWDRTNRNYEEEQRQKRALQMQKDLMNFKLEQQRQEEARKAKELGSLWDMVSGKNQFDDNLVKPQINMFQQPQNSTPIPLQEAQASPNNNNNNYSSVLFNDSIINGANPLTQETLNAGTQNYRNAFNNWKQNKPYTDEQWAIGKALNEGVYAPYPFMMKEIDKILSPALDTLKFFDPKTNLFMAVQTKNGIPIGDPYPVDKWKSGSSGNSSFSTKDDGRWIWNFNNRTGELGEKIAVSPQFEKRFYDSWNNENKLRLKDHKPLIPADRIQLGLKVLRESKDEDLANLVVGDYDTIRTVGGDFFGTQEIDILNYLKKYNRNTGQFNSKTNINGDNREVKLALDSFYNDVIQMARQYGDLVYDILPPRALDYPQVQEAIKEGLGEEVGNPYETNKKVSLNLR